MSDARLLSEGDRRLPTRVEPLTAELVPAGPPVPELTLSGQPNSGFNPREIARILFRWRWLILSSVLLATIIAVIITLTSTPLYRATATMEVNEQETQLIQGANVEPVAVRDPQFLATQYGLLRSTALAQRVARQLNLANDPRFASQAADRESREKSAAARVAEGFAVLPVSGSRLVKISFTGPDPAMAAAITNSFAENFISSDLERRYGATANARQFLQDRLATVKAALEKSERSLVEYAQRQSIVVVGGEGGASKDGSTPSGTSLDSSSLMALNAALTDAENGRILAEQRYRQASRSGQTSEALRDPVIEQLLQRRAQIQSDYDQKLELYRPDFPVMQQLSSQIKAIDTQLSRQKSGISGSLRGDYDAAVAREAALRARVGQLKSAVLDTRGRSIQYNILQREVDTNRTLYDALLQRYKEIGVAGRIGANLASIIDRADVPGYPFSPRIVSNLAIALILGLVLGIGLAFFVEFIDDTMKSLEDLRVKLHLAPLGAIPSLPKGEDFFSAVTQPQSAIGEAYFSLCTTIQFTTTHGVPRSILFSSTRSGEGKSSSVFATAQTFARMGRSVLLIDADMRKPTFESEVGSDVGLSNLLTSDSALRDHVVQTKIDNLWLLPSGRIPPNPAELLASGRMREILSLAEDAFDAVVIDGPPVLGLADAPLLSSMCLATLFVIEASAVRRPAALSAIGRLKASGGNVIGGVLTKLNAKSSGYGYGYGYGYGKNYGYSYGETGRTGALTAADPRRKIELV